MEDTANSMLERPIRGFTIRGRSLVVPLLNTRPITDIGVLFLLLPVWWVLGLDQVIWALGFAWIFLKMLVMRRYQIRIGPVARWIFVFILIHFISGAFIIENFRYVTFLRNYSTYVLSLFLLLIVDNSVKKWSDIHYLLIALILTMTGAAIVGVLGITGLWRPSFQTPVGAILPEWIVATSYGGRIAFKSVGLISWFVGINRYFRVNSFFLYPTHYAPAIAFTIPLVVFYLGDRRTHAIKKWLHRGILLLLSINLIFTTGRGAILAFLLGLIYYLIIASRWRAIVKLGVILAIIGLMVAILLVPQNFVELYQDFVLARGPGSFNSRMAVYRETITGALERPFFGWGTERDIPDRAFPAGSHSYYLGILYKQGILGLIVFLAIWVSLWRQTRPPKNRLIRTADQLRMARLLQAGRWVFVAAIFNSVTDVLDLDATLMASVWLLFGLLIAARRLYQSEYGVA